MSKAPPQRRQTVSLTTATSITVANMIGTGVFTSLGFQVADVRSGFALLLLWTLGGVFALCGALSYGELAAAVPRSGGELHFLGRIYHPLVGFLAGWLSVTVGFAAPIALTAMAFGRYFGRVVEGASPLAVSCAMVGAVTLAHLFNLRFGSYFQNLFTLFKVALILVFIAASLRVPSPEPLRFEPSVADLPVIWSAPFAIALLFVMYSYSGWNASTYITDEVEEPARNVPRSLLLGTALVMVLYVGLNWAFLTTAPISELEGKIEVGHVVAERIFGVGGGKVMSAMLCIALISAVSAMTWAGPRVTQVMGQDHALFRFLARTTPAGIPRRAILLQGAIVVTLLLTSTFEQVLVYIQLTLTLSSFLTVLGVFVLRRREPDLPRPYRTWGYPLTPALFLLISLFAMGYTLVDRPGESLAGLLTVLAGVPVYLLSHRG
jgi:APA family basic amino acid/polyamine antiporter